MKRILLAAASIAVILGTGAIVNAGPGNITWTVHNMSSSAPFGGRHWISSDTDQICIFCHTPHNAQPSQPLWNKVISAPGFQFQMYTSSLTLTSTAKAVTAPGAESLLCLSCHDGRTAINVIHNGNVGIDAGGGKRRLGFTGLGDDGYIDSNNPNGQALAMGVMPSIFGTPYEPNIGQTADDTYAGFNLMNDHPISFSYTAAQGEAPTKLKPIVNAKSQGLKFFGSDNRMECSTCHDPHVDYGINGATGTATGSPTGNTALRPFLVRDNAGSAMCLACHDK